MVPAWQWPEPWRIHGFYTNSSHRDRRGSHIKVYRVQILKRINGTGRTNGVNEGLLPITPSDPPQPFVHINNLADHHLLRAEDRPVQLLGGHLAGRVLHRQRPRRVAQELDAEAQV